MMAGDMAVIITASTVALGTLGAGIKFLWNKVEARFVAIDAALAQCEARERSGQERHAAQLAVIELLWQEVERVTGDGSRALARAAKLLADLRKEG